MADPVSGRALNIAPARVEAMLEATEAQPHSAAWHRARKVERACIVLLQSELDIALGFLRLAEAEMDNGSTAHADELIAKANSSFRTAQSGLANISLEFEEERRVLREGVRLLQEAIRAVVRRRPQELHHFC